MRLCQSWLIPHEPAGTLRVLPTWANGQLAFAVYGVEPALGRSTPIVLDVVSLEGDQISAVTAYTDTILFARFGLPESLEGMVREPLRSGADSTV